MKASTGFRVLFGQSSSYWSLSAFSGRFSRERGRWRGAQMRQPQAVAMSCSPPSPIEFQLEETSYTVDKTGGQKGSGLLQNIQKGKDSAPKALGASPCSSDWIIQALGLLQILPGKPRRLNQTHLFPQQLHLEKGHMMETSPGGRPGAAALPTSLARIKTRKILKQEIQLSHFSTLGCIKRRENIIFMSEFIPIWNC